MRYDLHTHTHFSPCSGQSPTTLLKMALKSGMDGIAVTDHDSIKGALAVEKLIRRHNRRNNDDFGFIRGCEYLTDAGDLLAYFVDDTLPGKGPQDINTVIDRVHSTGGIVAPAHPFTAVRHGLTIPLKEIAGRIDAIEGFNGRMLEYYPNARARDAAEQFGLGLVGGSDGHFWFEVARAWTEFSGATPEDLRNAILKRRTTVSGTTFYGTVGAFSSPVFQLMKKARLLPPTQE